MKNNYESNVTLGARYRDVQTGIEGTAIAVAFFQYGCERVTLETVVDGKIEEYFFDAPRVEQISNTGSFRQSATGGPHKTPSRRGAK